jgi:hypothetical protein
MQVTDPPFGFAAIAGHARRVVDERDLPANESVEKRRFADIGSADNGDERTHDVVLPAPQGADDEASGADDAADETAGAADDVASDGAADALAASDDAVGSCGRASDSAEVSTTGGVTSSSVLASTVAEPCVDDVGATEEVADAEDRSAGAEDASVGGADDAVVSTGGGGNLAPSACSCRT